MKSIVVLIALFIVGYWLYTFYQENPGELPSIGHRQKDLVSTPVPVTPEPAKVAPPDLASVPVLNGPTLTHVRVKDARAKSLVFMCDQGLFEISYDKLSPGFKAYYTPKVTPVPTDADGNPIPTPTPTPAPTVIQPAPGSTMRTRRRASSPGRTRTWTRSTAGTSSPPSSPAACRRASLIRPMPTMTPPRSRSTS